ncbi:MAG TPA: type II secretion system F family protein, partial [Bacillota bacterium]|nr:type II secretion system F family protein [Bacillota bacterium]
MQTYAYKAKNIDGSLVTGSTQAEDRTSVISALKQKGYFLLNIEQEDNFSTFIRSKTVVFGNHVSLRERGIYTHQLATLLKAGLQLTMALKTLSKQTKNKYFISVINCLHNDIQESSSLSEAMSQHPRIFPKIYTAVIAAAEESGSLVESLQNLSQQLKSQAVIHSRIRGAMTYPLFLLFICVAVVCVLVMFVIPKFLELFVNAHQKLPMPTQILIGLIDFMKGYWWAIPLAGIGLVCLGTMLLKHEQARTRFDGFLLRLPLIGTLNEKIQMARFARTLGALLNGGVKILSAIEILKAVTTNLAFMRDINNILEDLKKGSSLAKAVKRQPYFNELTSNM